MKCPECGSKIGQKNYDAAYSWYECPKCEGCFTGDEIVEAEIAAHSREMDTDSRRSSIRGAGGSDSPVGGKSKPTKKVVAKAKKKREEADADAEAVADYEKSITENIVVQKRDTKHRDEVSIGQVVQIMADEIETIYTEVGWQPLSRDAAEDKALTLWRNLVVHDGISAREKAFDVPLCSEHA